MSSTLLSVFFLVLVHSDTSWTALPSIIRIGGIFDKNDGGSYSASELAFTMAINDINNATILRGVILQGITNTTNPLNIEQSVNSVCEQLDKGVVAVVGPPRSTVVKATNYICSGIGLPQVSYAATDPTLFTGHQQYPFLVRTSSSGDSQSVAIMDLMTYFKWAKAVMLTSSDDYGAVSFKYLCQSSFERKISIVKTESFPALDDPLLIDFNSPLLSLRSQGVRLVILNCLGKYSRRVLDIASSLGMMEKGWVWIVSDAIATEANLYDVTLGTPAHLRGILGIVPSSARVKNKANFEAKWTANGGKLPISVFFYKVYDAVWVIASALHSIALDEGTLSPPSVSCVQCQQNKINQWNDGKILLEKIKHIQLTGQLHPIQFNNQSSVLYEAYDFVNLQNTGFEKVGYWDNSSGLSMNWSDILWLGDISVSPQTSAFSFKNKIFRIVTITEPPFTMKKFGNHTGNDVWEGYCIDMLKKIANELEFNYVLHASYDGKFGAKDSETQEWNGMVNELASGQADMAAAAFSINSARQEIIDFTGPYIDLGLAIIMKEKTREKGLLAFKDPFTNDVWFLLFGSTMCVGFVLYVCSKLSPYGYYGQTVQTDENLLTEENLEEFSENKNNMRLDEAAWFSMGSLLGQGTDHQPKAISGKIVAAVWWMAGTIFIATYTANLVAFLTVTKSAIAIRSVEDLASQNVIKYGTVASSHTSQFFKQSNIPVFQRMWAEMKSEEMVESSSKGFEKVQDGDFAFIWDSAVLEYVIHQDPCNTFMLNDVFSPFGYGIGLPLNSPYKDAISKEILKLRETGYLDKLKLKWFVEKGTCGVTSTTSPKRVIVDLADVIGVYYLVAAGVVLGFIVLVFEWFYFIRKLAKKEDSDHPTYKEPFKARFKLMWKDIASRWISKRSFVNKT